MAIGFQLSSIQIAPILSCLEALVAIGFQMSSIQAAPIVFSFLKAWYLLLSAVYHKLIAPIALSCQEALVAIGFQMPSIQ